MLVHRDFPVCSRRQAQMPQTAVPAATKAATTVASELAAGKTMRVVTSTQSIGFLDYDDA